jgi:DNA-directed RNA polymerase subunit RPC12/RpoP
MTRKASRHPQDIVSGDAKPLSWRERIIQTFNQDPADCPQCGRRMVIHEVRPAPRRYPPGARPTQRQRLLQLTLALT